MTNRGKIKTGNLLESVFYKIICEDKAESAAVLKEENNFERVIAELPQQLRFKDENALIEIFDRAVNESRLQGFNEGVCFFKNLLFSSCSHPKNY